MISIPLVLSTALCVAVAPCLALPSPAAQQPDEASVQALRAPPPAALRDIDKTYELANGRRLHVAARDSDTLRVRYGRRNERWLRHDGNGSFVSHDGLMSLQFGIDAAGQPDNVRVTVPASWR